MIQSERQRRAYLNALGIDLWVPRAADDADTCDAEPEHASPVDALDWDSLRDAITACTRCELCETRTQTVFGVGNPQADWMIIGEAPGAEEDRRGEPFVGRAGKLLDEMLRAVGLDREQAFIANILKCRPPNNRDPKPDESAACRAYLTDTAGAAKNNSGCRQDRRSAIAEHGHACWSPARFRASTRWQTAGCDLSSGIPAAQSYSEAQGLG
jgi:hypothetical protein